VRGGTDAGKILRARVRVVGNYKSTHTQAALKQGEYGRIEILRSIEENKIDRVWQISGKCFQRIAFANFYQIG
jgi:hypothetical protein